MVNDDPNHDMDSQEEEDQKPSLKDLLMLIQKEMRTVRNKVGRFEQQLN